MNRSAIFIFFLTILSSCSNKSENQSSYPENLFSINQEGKLIEKAYTFCSTVPEEIKYSYRVGIWTFQTPEGKIIAKGEYDSEIVTVDTHGGCPYSYVKNIVDLKKWEFWNLDGEKIEPTKRLISLIKLNIG